MPARKLNPAMIEHLRFIASFDGPFKGERQTHGALAKRGLIVPSFPWAITDAGRAALAAIDGQEG